MKYLVATKETQGRRKSDFFWCEEGEPVSFSFECDSDKNNIDGRCGCRRSMSGVRSHKATTTMKVVDLSISKAKLEKILRRNLSEGGWLVNKKPAETKARIRYEIDELMRIAKGFDIGAVIEKRGNKFQIRKQEKHYKLRIN